jgi:hypothetical protein
LAHRRQVCRARGGVECQIQNLRTKCCRMVVFTSRLVLVEGLLQPGEDLAQGPHCCRAHGGVDARFRIYVQGAAEWWCSRLDWCSLKAFGSPMFHLRSIMFNFALTSLEPNTTPDHRFAAPYGLTSPKYLLGLVVSCHVVLLSFFIEHRKHGLWSVGG